MHLIVTTIPRDPVFTPRPSPTDRVAQSVQKFKAFDGAPDQELSEAERRENTVMPWNAYAGMSREDLSAIYRFLRSQKPVINRVELHSSGLSAAR